MPTIDVPRADLGTVAWQVNGERTRPHSIMVNDSGVRFTNEAATYNAFGAAFHVLDVTSFEYVNHPCWLIFDDHYWRHYGLAGNKADKPVPDWIVCEESLEGLTKALGLPPEQFAATITRWNDHAAQGRDPDFRRGDSVYDRWWGDPAYEGLPASTIGPIERPPFYAVRVRSGALGTKGGPRTDNERPRARRGRRPDTWPLRGRQRDGLRHGDDLRRGWRHSRAGHGLRLSGWPAHRKFSQ